MKEMGLRGVVREVKCLVCKWIEWLVNLVASKGQAWRWRRLNDFGSNWVVDQTWVNTEIGSQTWMGLVEDMG